MDTMDNIKILGAYGTKGQKNETTSFLISKHNVIDAGNLLRSLGDFAGEIDGIWITHPHLDHIMDIAYILDSYFAIRRKPLKLMGSKKTLDAVKQHFLNNVIWPDFSMIKLLHTDEMSVVYQEIEAGVFYDLEDNTQIKAFLSDHTPDSYGYIVKKNDKAIIISSDTYSLDNLIEEVKKDDCIKSMVIECSFPSSMDELALVSKHLTPKLMFEKLKPLKNKGIKLNINHLKPLYEEIIVKEIDSLKAPWACKVLKDLEEISY